MEWTFREAQTSDVEAMLFVRAHTRQNPISAEQLAALGITAPSVATGIANGQIKGCVCLARSGLIGFCNGDSVTGEILVLAVLPEYEGKGIGKRLLAETVSWLASIGHEQPWLAASPDPEIRAHGFYRAMGWKPTARSLRMAIRF